MIALDKKVEPVEKLATGIQGFDLISVGGLPLGRTTLVSGTAGGAKTVFASQFLAEGIRQAGEPGRLCHLRGNARRPAPQPDLAWLGRRRLGSREAVDVRRWFELRHRGNAGRRRL